MRTEPYTGYESAYLCFFCRRAPWRRPRGGVSINGSLGCRISEVGTGTALMFHIGGFYLESPWVVYISELRAQILGPMLGLKELFVRILR
jgi:hypothetical protein